jgi:hypothetical protein
VLTAADYALWDWSIADGHDIVSLVAGLTLLPLAAATLALLAVGAARLLAFALERTSASERNRRRAAHGRAHRAGAGRHSAVGPSPARTHAQARAGVSQQPAAPARPAETAAGRERSSRRLAA